jgi:hypothetical protein
MAHTVKGRSKAIDNIAAGAAISSRERTINGSLPPDFTTIGNGENIQAGVDYGTERPVSGSALILTERRTP